MRSVIKPIIDAYSSRPRILNIRKYENINLIGCKKLVDI